MRIKNSPFIALVFMVIIMVPLLFASCKEKDPDPEPEYGTVTDIDGNVYKTVKIGEQWWMADNLKVKRFRDGRQIFECNNIFDTINWVNRASYSLYDYNTATEGFLYNWKAVSDYGMLAPAGWHVPTDEEWKELESYLGMDSQELNKVNWRGNEEGAKLKKEGSKYWVVTNHIWGNNESGFSAIGSGCRMFNHSWSEPYGLRFMGFWWSSSEHSDTTAWYRHLDHKTSEIFRYYGSVNYGFNVRCVKD